MIPSVYISILPLQFAGLSLRIISFYSIINTETLTFSTVLLTQQAKADLTIIPHT
mgnify:FL=1